MINVTRYKRILIAFVLLLCLGLLGCANTPVETTPAETTPADTTPAETTPAAETYEYYTATLDLAEELLAEPYTEGGSVPAVLNGLYYSAKAPGGAPVKDGTGCIWLKLTPTKNYRVSKITIEGTYTSVEEVSRDVYCISGVGSDLSVKITSKRLFASTKEMFGGFGYGITDQGQLVISWEVDPAEPLRYVMLNYKDKDGNHPQYVDASLGRFEWFTLPENVVSTVSIQPIGYTQAGKTETLEVRYMPEPRSVSFPRVEITTEDYLWPDCDTVASPDKYWGASIQNALYRQCIMTVYDASNNVVYDSSREMAEGEAFLGAKMKIRGNTSATHASHDKYPYKVKLSTKADLLAPLTGRPDDGAGYADKDWLLLNFGEEGFRIGGEAIADAVGTVWSPDYCYVSLYVNGDYRGLYVLSESVKRGNGTGEEQARVPVDKDGFVFECDAYWWNEDLYFNTPLTENTAMFYTFKHPDPDDITEESPEYIYLKDYMTRFEEALKKDDDSYLDYIDLDSFVRWQLVSDYLCINDGGGANIFLYKKDATDNSKLCLGPNWDFDSWMGAVDGYSTVRLNWTNHPFYMPELMKKESFAKRYEELFYETYKSLDAYIDAAYEATDNEAHLQLLKYENTRFGTKAKSLADVKEEFKSWLDKHLAWMEDQFN